MRLESDYRPRWFASTVYAPAVYFGRHGTLAAKERPPGESKAERIGKADAE